MRKLVNAMESHERSILDDVTPFAWDNETAIAYEVTIEEINRVVGGYASLLSRHTAGDGTSAQTVAGWREAGQRFVALRRALRPDDPTGITAARRDAAVALDTLRSLR